MDTFTTANATYIDPRLAVGGDLDEISRHRARAQLDELVCHGITHILDLRIEYSDEELVADLAPSISYLHLGVDDAGQRLPGEWFDAGIRWLNDAMAHPDTKALVHCHMGINRAPSMAFAYLLNQGRSVRDALDTIRRARSIAVIDYAADALDWHHTRTGASASRRASDQAALDAWRADNLIDMEQTIRGVRGDEVRRSTSADLARMFTKFGNDDQADGYRTWLFQMSKDYAEDARADAEAGVARWIMPIGRHEDQVLPGDLVLLWEMGPKATAGLFGCGLVYEVGVDALRPRDWENRTGPEKSSEAVEIEFLAVVPGLLLTRPELKETKEFSDGSFDLFKMAQRANPFPVESAHLARMGELLAVKAGTRS